MRLLYIEPCAHNTSSGFQLPQMYNERKTLAISERFKYEEKKNSAKRQQ